MRYNGKSPPGWYKLSPTKVRRARVRGVPLATSFLFFTEAAPGWPLVEIMTGDNMLIYFTSYLMVAALILFLHFFDRRRVTASRLKETGLMVLGYQLEGEGLWQPSLRSGLAGVFVTGSLFWLFVAVSWTGSTGLLIAVSVIAAVGAVILGMFMMQFGVTTGLYTMASGILVSGLFHMLFFQSVQVLKGRIDTQADLAMVRQQPEIMGFVLRRHQIREDLTGHITETTRQKNSTTTSHYYATPLVPLSWDATRPVQVWAVYEGHTRAENRLPHDASGDLYAIRSLSPLSDSFEKAARHSIRSSGLKAQEPPLFVQLVANLDLAKSEARRELMLFWLGTSAAWILLCTSIGVILKLKG